MKMKRILALMLASVVAFSVAACGGGGDEKTAGDSSDKAGEAEEIVLDIMVHYAGETDRVTQFAVDKLKEEFPNVTLRFEDLPSDGGQTVKTRAATGDLPDLILVDSGSIEILAKSESIIPIEDYIEEFGHKELLLDSIIDNYLVSSDGHTYQFPTGGISPILWYYNVEIFEENNIKVPENFDELLDTVEALRAADIIPLAMFGKEPWPLGAFFDMLTLKEEPSGIYGLSEHGKKASDPEYVNAIDKMGRLVDAGIFQDGVTNTDYDVASAMFLERQAAMFINGSWYLQDAYEGLGDNVDFIESYPTADAGSEEVNKYCMTGGGDTAGIAVSADTPDKDLAAKVAARFAYYREVGEYTINQFITAPIIADDYETENPLDPMSEKLSGLVGDYTYDSTFLHVLPNTKLATVLTEELQKFLVGQPAEEFIKNVDAVIEQ